MAYLTKSNVNRVIGSADLLSMELTGIIYDKPIYFFNPLEYKKLIAYYTLCSNPEYFILKYIPVKNVDTLDFVWQSGVPAYHQDISCEKVQSDFKNIKVPQQIKQAGNKAVEEFRNWFKQTEVTNLYYNDEDAFMARMHLKFVKYMPSKPEKISYDNSGQEHFENFDLEDIKNKIDYILQQANQLIANANIITRKAIVMYDKHTHYAIKNNPFPNNLQDPEILIGIHEEKLRNFLIEYDKRFKAPVFNLLKHYYRVKFNPELQFKDTLLDQLGFRKCTACH